MKYYLITDRRFYKQDLPRIASQAEAAGLDFFQLREKDVPVRELLPIAKNIRSVLSRTKFIVNGSLEVALASEADGVHLQRENIPVETVRSKYSSLIIGYSAHNYEEMKDAADQGASYLFISPVFPPISKNSLLQTSVAQASLPANQLKTIGPATAVAWANSVEIPVFALGGITDANQTELIEAGCRRIAGISLFIQDGMFTTKGLVA